MSFVDVSDFAKAAAKIISNRDFVNGKTADQIPMSLNTLMAIGNKGDRRLIGDGERQGDFHALRARRVQERQDSVVMM